MDILIIEDNTITRMVFKKLVHTLGYAVTVCDTAEEALNMCQKQFFPIIILDLGLPGINGFEFCRRLRAQPHQDYSMILVVTACDNPQDVHDALEAGADDYIVKPVGAELLQMRLTIMERRAMKLMQQQADFDAPAKPDVPMAQAVADFEKQYLSNVLDRYHWHPANTASALEISESVLSKKIRQYQLTPPTT